MKKLSKVQKIGNRIRRFVGLKGVLLKPGNGDYCAVGRLAQSVGKTFDSAFESGLQKLDLKKEQPTNLENGFELDPSNPQGKSRPTRCDGCGDGGCNRNLDERIATWEAGNADFLKEHLRRLNKSPYYLLGAQLREEALDGQYEGSRQVVLS